MGEVLVITSGKGGVGKTTVTANLGVGLAALGKRVVMIDTDIGLRNLDVMVGLENRIVYNLVDVVEEGCSLSQALIADPRHEGLFLLPTAQTRDKSAVTPEQMKKLTDELKEQYDYVLLDCPAGIEQGFQNAIAGADRAVVVTTPETFAIRDADRIIGLLTEHGIRQCQLMLNRIRPNLVRQGEMMSEAEVEEILPLPVLGVIPDDDAVVVSANRGEPIVGTATLSGRLFADACRRILGEEVPFGPLEEKKGWLARRKERKAARSR